MPFHCHCQQIIESSNTARNADRYNKKKLSTKKYTKGDKRKDSICKMRIIWYGDWKWQSNGFSLIDYKI